jgi:hypothetical protein
MKTVNRLLHFIFSPRLLHTIAQVYPFSHDHPTARPYSGRPLTWHSPTVRIGRLERSEAYFDDPFDLELKRPMVTMISN